MKTLNIFGLAEANEVQPSFVAGMQDHSQFVRTTCQGDQPRNDMGDCIIQTSYPYLVFKIHSFLTNSRKAEGVVKEKQKLQEFLQERNLASSNAFNAKVDGVSVEEYVNGTDDLTYDEEFDEHRLLSKAPGYNIYLEFRGSLLRDFTPQWQKVGDIMRRATCFALCTYITSTREQCRDDEETAPMQLLPDWEEPQPDLDFKAEKAYYYPYRGIGVEPQTKDFNRRPLTYKREKITSEEAQAHMAKQVERLIGA